MEIYNVQIYYFLFLQIGATLSTVHHETNPKIHVEICEFFRGYQRPCQTIQAHVNFRFKILYLSTVAK